MSSVLQTFTARSQGEPQTEPMMSDTLSVRKHEVLLPLRQSSELGMRGIARLSAVLLDPVCPQQRCLGAHPPCLLLASDVSRIFTLSLFSPIPLKEGMLPYFAVLDSRWVSGNFTLLLIPSIPTTSLSCADQICPRRIAPFRAPATNGSGVLRTPKPL